MKYGKALVGMLAMLLWALASCGVNTTSVNPGVTSIPSPRVGSIFGYQYVNIDSNENAITSPQPYGADTVVEVGLSLFGRTNVTRFTQFLGRDCIAYDSSGDLSYLVIGSGQVADWIAVPITSRATKSSITPNPGSMVWYTFKNRGITTIAGVAHNSVTFDASFGDPSQPTGSFDHRETFDEATGVLLTYERPSLRGTNGQFSTGYIIEVSSFHLQ